MPQLFRVTATGLNLRSAPALGDNVILVLPRNHVVERIERDDASGFCKVATFWALADFEGWVAGSQITPLNEEPAPVAAGDLSVTAAKLKRLASNARNSVVDPLDGRADGILSRFAINANARRLTQFLAQIAHESGGFRLVEENLNYGWERLRQVFPSHFPTDADAQSFDRQPQRIANRAYANRIGNGPESSGDGWRYRGRGLIQLTGRANYRRFGSMAGLDLENDPDLAREPANALLIATAFWDAHDLNSPADRNHLKTITRRINGGLNGLHDRQAYLDRARAIWGDQP